MNYTKINIDFKGRNYCKIVKQIDDALDKLHEAIIDNVFENNKTGYKLNTGQSDVSVTIDTERDAIANIMRLEKLREFYLNQRINRRGGRVVRLRDQNNFR